MSCVRTPEHRKQQAERIRAWSPWEQSTGPRSPEGKAASSMNAWKAGTGRCFVSWRVYSKGTGRPSMRWIAERHKAKTGHGGRL